MPEEAVTKSEPKKADPGKKTGGSTEAAVLKGDIEIYPHKPIEKYSVGEVRAYQASSMKEGGGLFALVCEPHLVPRVKAAEVYQGFINPSLPGLVNRGIVFWPPAGAQRYVLVYRDVLGNPLKPIEGKEAFGWKEDTVLEVMVKPLVNALQDFRDKDFVHGSIRPSNMFDGSASGNLQKVFLGDCLAVPCSYTQSALYEPPKRAMTSPIGRGKALLADDMYALGVSIAVLMRHNDPMQGMDRKQIIRQKMELGSYAAVTGKDRFRGSILELLRGLLIDDPSQRWTLDEVLLWLDGNRLSPKQATKLKKAHRPLMFGQNKYSYMPFLAMDLPDNPSELLHIIETQELEQWIVRAFEDDEAEMRLVEALKEAAQGGKGGSYPERVVTTVSGALDVMAPLRYKGLRLTADAFGNAMARAMMMKEDIKPYVELLSGTLILNWMTVSENPSVDKGALGTKMDSCRHYLRQSKYGYGIERCLYVLAPEVHCLSDKLQDYQVRTPEDMIRAFEDICAKGRAPALFVDRHSAAFLSVKDSRSIDSFLFDLSGSEEHKRVLANLKIFGIIQNREKLGPLPALSETFFNMLSCVFERFHDQTIRENMKKEIRKFSQAGDLVKMAALLDNPDVVNRDMGAFKDAMIEYRQLTKEAEELEAKLVNPETFGRTTGRAIGSVVSSIVAGVIILILAFMFISGQALF